jgi:hypothetical protein
MTYTQSLRARAARYADMAGRRRRVNDFRGAMTFALLSARLHRIADVLEA